MMKKLLILGLWLSLTAYAQAECWYNGHMYPVGTVIAGLACHSDGRWR
ncbi:hypothetical protein NO559_16260 [Dasania sp. GY-MA-18]|uniref:Uncharacterized protein n=1 Tax=Dasania phycosphaerae TaxID=2950436 RepID=A0A9J6RQK6_9GAMM|nr:MULTISPECIES: hypothetical protein [Dasania]MCR8924329.1 hypothetical protein [Dasania sp. GY-MA-18]MCZ0866982.1 hypothetical protein [Dasania phycosphaerae]MCZ0870486.1 hypothetical protein [Dasania phycosphaerae]